MVEVPWLTQRFKTRVGLLLEKITFYRGFSEGIMIGIQGNMTREIGVTARKEIEGMTGRNIYLDLRVKVHKNWRNNPDALNLMGYIVQENP